MADDKGKGKQPAQASYGTGDKRRAESSSASSASSRQPSPAAPSSFETGFAGCTVSPVRPVPEWTPEQLARFQPTALKQPEPSAPSTATTRSGSGGALMSDIGNPPPAPRPGAGSLSRTTPNIPPSGPTSGGPIQPTGTGTSVGNLPAASPRPAPPTAVQPRSTGSGGTISSSPGSGVASSGPSPGARQHQTPRPEPMEPRTHGSGGSLSSGGAAVAMASWGPCAPARPSPSGGRHQGSFVAEPSRMGPDNRPPPNQGRRNDSGSHSQRTDRDLHRNQRRRTDESGYSH